MCSHGVGRVEVGEGAGGGAGGGGLSLMSSKVQDILGRGCCRCVPRCRTS